MKTIIAPSSPSPQVPDHLPESWFEPSPERRATQSGGHSIPTQRNAEAEISLPEPAEPAVDPHPGPGPYFRDEVTANPTPTSAASTPELNAAAEQDARRSMPEFTEFERQIARAALQEMVLQGDTPAERHLAKIVLQQGVDYLPQRQQTLPVRPLEATPEDPTKNEARKQAHRKYWSGDKSNPVTDDEQPTAESANPASETKPVAETREEAPQEHVVARKRPGVASRISHKLRKTAASRGTRGPRGRHTKPRRRHARP